MLRAAAGAVINAARTGVGAASMPRVLTWTLAFRCNARCSMCDSWRKPSDDEADTRDALRIVDRLPKSISVVRLTGGEPFLRNDLGRIVDALERRLHPGMLHLTTNGFLTSRIVDFLEDRAGGWKTKLHLLVSLDGMEGLHDAIRGVEGAFRRAEATLRAVAENRRRWNVELAVNQTVLDQRGIDDYEPLHAMLASMGVPHHVVVAYAESATYSATSRQDVSPASVGEYRTGGEFDRVALGSFLDRVNRDSKELPFGNRIAKRYYLQGIGNRLLHSEGDPSPRCAALGGHMRIFPDGSIPVCQFNGKVVGNLLEDEFEAIWRRAETRAQRDWVARCPGCWAECEVLPSAALHGDLLRRLPALARRA